MNVQCLVVVRLMRFCVNVCFSNGRKLLHVAGTTIEENQFPSHLQHPQHQLPVEYKQIRVLHKCYW
jgi:hypothetical protein